MEQRELGRTGLKVSAVGLGLMGMSGMYGSTDDGESVRAIRAAVDGGVTLIDTGDFYGMGHNEMLLARALEEMGAGTRERLVLSVKFGAMRSPSGAWAGADCRPVAVKNFLAYSLQRLRVERVDVYRPARLDDKVPIEDTMGAVAEMVKQGYVRFAGLSEVSSATARRAQAVTPVADVQLEYGLSARGMEAKVLPGLREIGVGVTAYGVLGRGLLTGARAEEKSDFRRFLPRFVGQAGEANRGWAERLAGFAAERGWTRVEVLLAWALSRGEDVVPVVGSRTVRQVEEMLRGAERRLSPTEMQEMEGSLPADEIQGTRYDRVAMTHLDSER